MMTITDKRIQQNKFIISIKWGKKERKRRGELGKKWALGDEAGFTSEKMTQKIINGIEELFSTWKPKSRFSFVKDTSYKRKTLPHKLSY